MINQLKKIGRKNKFIEQAIWFVYKLCSLFFSALFLLCRVFPVKENKIVCCNMKGKRYGDNPKYILDEIIAQGLDYEMVWLLKNPEDETVPKQIKCVTYNPFSLAYHLSTAKIWIDSNTKSFGTLKRKNQCYIQTWHGSYGLKKIGLDLDEHEVLFGSKPFYFNAKIEDIMVSNSRMTTEIYRRAFAYNGKILECGSPRNDIFFENPEKYKRKVCEYFSINDCHLALFAPTYRSDFNTDCMRMDFERVLQALKQRFGGEWSMLIRLHPSNMNDAEEFIRYSDTVINATDYDVMQELLAASDVLITDYSSCMFDFVTSPRPCFIYATDIDKYKGERDFYFDIFSLPFPVAQNNDEMTRNIKEFDKKQYRENLEHLFEQVGLCDKGTACRQVVEYMESLKGDRTK